jgi:hypothetical protein
MSTFDPSPEDTMDNPAISLLFGTDIGILSMVTVIVALLIVVVLGIAFYIKSGGKPGQGKS